MTQWPRAVAHVGRRRCRGEIVGGRFASSLSSTRAILVLSFSLYLSSFAWSYGISFLSSSSLARSSKPELRERGRERRREMLEVFSFRYGSVFVFDRMVLKEHTMVLEVYLSRIYPGLWWIIGCPVNGRLSNGVLLRVDVKIKGRHESVGYFRRR